MIRLPSAERGALPLVVGGVLIALILVGALADQSGHGDRATSAQISLKGGVTGPGKVPPPAETAPSGGVSPSVVAAGFAAAFETQSWRDTPASLGARVARWSAPVLRARLDQPAQGGPPAEFVAERSVTSARVGSVSVDPVDSSDDLALVTLTLTTSSPATATNSTQRELPLQLTLLGGRWAVSSVPGLVP